MTTDKKFLLNPTLADMPRQADVIVMGGGPAGAGAVWALGRAAPHLKIVLIEKSERLGSGSSTASLENYRTCWPALCLAQQVGRSVEIFHHADEYLGEGAAQALHLKERGYLFCAFTESHAQTLQRDVVRLHEIGLSHIEYLDAAEVAQRFPWLAHKVIAAKFDPSAGWLDSNALIYRFVQSTPNVQTLLGISESHIQVSNGRVTGVKTPLGEISAPVVVIANGANARPLARSAGVELPIIVRPRQSFTTSWRHPEFPADAPMLIGEKPFPHVRPEAQSGAIFGWEYTWSPKARADGLPDALWEPIYPPAPLKDPRFPSLTLALMARQFGDAPGQGFASPRYLQGISHNIGYYVFRGSAVAQRSDGTPYDSERALIDAVPEVAGLFVSVAHVGHGVMSSPAAGEMLASKVLGIPHPLLADFGYAAHWVEYDEAVL